MVLWLMVSADFFVDCQSLNLTARFPSLYICQNRLHPYFLEKVYIRSDHNCRQMSLRKSSVHVIVSHLHFPPLSGSCIPRQTTRSLDSWPSARTPRSTHTPLGGTGTLKVGRTAETVLQWPANVREIILGSLKL